MTPTRAEAFRFWFKLGFISFGGPAGQIAIMHRELVETKRWISEERFLHALNFCMLLPGPEAQQLATYIGWLKHGTRGGIAAGVLFVLPGFLLITLIGALYVKFHSVGPVEGILFGLKASVLAVVIDEQVVRAVGWALLVHGKRLPGLVQSGGHFLGIQLDGVAECLQRLHHAHGIVQPRVVRHDMDARHGSGSGRATAPGPSRNNGRWHCG